MSNQNYLAWMNQVNEFARKHNRIICRNKKTWAAYRAGMNPVKFARVTLKLERG